MLFWLINSCVAFYAGMDNLYDKNKIHKYRRHFNISYLNFEKIIDFNTNSILKKDTNWHQPVLDYL